MKKVNNDYPPPTKQGFIRVYGSNRLKYHFYTGEGMLCGRHKEFIPMLISFENENHKNCCKICKKKLQK